MTDLNWLARAFSPAAMLIGPEQPVEALSHFEPNSLVSVTVDHSARGIASVCVDDDSIAAHALEHLLGTGLRQLSTFRFGDSAFAVARERTFMERARTAGASVAPGWGSDEAGRERSGEDPAVLLAWLRELPKPCGIFTCTDGWARTVSRYARLAGLRVPEDVALIGADNDVLECELIAPPLSSVVIPWQELGDCAAKLVQRSLSGQKIAGERVVIRPIAVMSRRSSDVLAIQDPLVASAVQWIRSHADRRLTVPMVARAVGGGRQRLERRFRRVLDRTIQDEIRRAHVEMARTLLETTRSSVAEVAKRSGFSNAALLTAAFWRELGVSPGRYRRRAHDALLSANDDRGQ